MTSVPIYLVTALVLFGLGLAGLLLGRHLLRKVLALNLMASAVFLMLVLFAYRPPGSQGDEAPDPVPHAMVLTGIVVAFSASAVAVALARLIHSATGESSLPEER